MAHTISWAQFHHDDFNHSLPLTRRFSISAPADTTGAHGPRGEPRAWLRGQGWNRMYRAENCGIFDRKQFTAKDAKVAEQILPSNLCVLRPNPRPSAKSVDHSGEIAVGWPGRYPSGPPRYSLTPDRATIFGIPGILRQFQTPVPPNRSRHSDPRTVAAFMKRGPQRFHSRPSPFPR